LDDSLAQADIIILAMRAALRHYYVVTQEDNIQIRMEVRNIELYRKNHAEWFKQNFSVVNIGVRDRLALIRQAFEAVGRQSRAKAAVFVIGANTRNVKDVIELTASVAYNKFCEKFCQEHKSKFHFVEVDKVVPESSLIDSDHFTRIGYHALCVHIMNAISAEQST
jgi:hypothetical protein